MSISFDEVLYRLEGVLIHWGYYTNVSSITVIRDIYGRISLFLEGDSNQFAGHLDPLKNKCALDLGGYWGGSVLYQNRKITPIQYSVIQAIISERSVYIPQSPALQGLQMYYLERTVAKKAWIQLQSADTAPWSYDDANSASAPKIVSFYSFKGGMGRTTAMAGVGLLLAKEGKKVILVDTDVEAPGLASLFYPSARIEYGVLDYFLDKNVGAMDSIQNYVYEYDLMQVLDNNNDGRLSIVPAGVVNSDYLAKLARIDLQEYRKNSLRESMANLLNDLRTAFPDTDYILIDARAGFHDLGGVALGQIPHGAVLFGNDSDQSWSGMEQAIRFVAQTQKDTMFLIMAAGMSEPRSSERYGDRLNAFAKRSHELFCGTYYTDSVPGIESEDAPHYPIAVEFNRSLQQNIHLYPIGGIAEETRKAQAELLMTVSYQKIAERIKGYFN